MRNWFLGEDEFLAKFDAGEEINERCLLEYAYIGDVISEGEDRRWSRTMESIVKIKDRYFKITWEKGLTEMQEDECYYNPEEYELIEYDKEIPEIIIPAHIEHVVEWKAKERK